ncbi:MAG: hypothetical protein HUU56_02055 [Bdellovibrionaceae bacterium]|nr:hypothetical protein [Pseudobdellovibrionaceae bacterium]
MKKFIFLTTILIIKSGFAATSVCFTKIAFHEKWMLSEKQISCMNKDSKFALATTLLCLTDQSEISAPYAKFLAYKIKIDEAFARFQAATNPGDRYLANADLQDLKQAQSTHAVINGIWEALNSVNSLKYNCEQHSHSL